MKIYFIRHGQTKYNEKYLHQPKDAELSELGIKQAKVLAKRFSKIPIDIIYSSSLKRAEQTAEIINKKLNKKVVYSDLLKEKKGPSELTGKRADGSDALKINKLKNLHQDDPLWHYSDEENYIEFKERMKKALKILSGLKKKNVLVVSHGGPIKMLILLMIFGEDIKPEFFYKFADSFKTYNTGITLCEKNEKGNWIVRAFNDHAHLG